MVFLARLHACVLATFALANVSLVASAVQIPATNTADADSKALNEALQRAFPTADALMLRVAALSDVQRAALTPLLRTRQAPRLWTYREARKAGALLGHAIEGEVLGKSLPITYLVLLDAEERVRGIEILNYRESHGGEVRREKWRAQFTGKSANDTLKLGSDIRNIAGATLSCRALTDAVHDVLAIAALVLHETAQDSQPATAMAAARCVAPTSSGVQERVQLLMGTLLELRAAVQDRAQFDAAADAAFARVAELEALWSTWRPESEVSRLNAAAPGVWIELSPATLALLERATALGQASGGAFAVEIGALVDLWHAGEALQRDPSAEQIANAQSATVPGAFELDVAHQRARRSCAAAKLDLGGIGKGAALDEVANVFRARGLSRALFDFGGQLLALDGPSADVGWPVVVRDPRPGRATPLWELELRNASLSTSADDQRGLLIAGKRRSHILDPRSGRPADAHWAVCTWCPNATDADAWSTAAFVLDHAACVSVAAQRGLCLLTLDRDDSVWTTASFPGRRDDP